MTDERPRYHGGAKPVSSSPRALQVFAICLGLIGVGVGTSYLRSGEIVVDHGSRPRKTLTEDQRVTGRIDRDDLAFYPIAIGWAAIGATTVVASACAWCTGSRLLSRAAGVGCAGVLLVAAATIGSAYWYGKGPPVANPRATAVAEPN